eukprot:906845-Rhodomonas_salina.1
MELEGSLEKMSLSLPLSLPPSASLRDPRAGARGGEPSELKLRECNRLRACYALSGTEIVYGRVSLRAFYAMSGTEIAYGARRVLILELEETRLRCAIALRDVRY